MHTQVLVQEQIHDRILFVSMNLVEHKISIVEREERELLGCSKKGYLHKKHRAKIEPNTERKRISETKEWGWKESKTK